MHEAKNTKRALVRIGYDGKVHKTFRGPQKEERFENEVRVLKYLEQRGCPFVPRLLDSDADKLEIVTSNCGAIAPNLSEDRAQEIFEQLKEYGVRHDDAFARNITYRAQDGRFCVIDFEFAEILDGDVSESESAAEEVGTNRAISWSACTDRGRFRPNNEDAFLVALIDQAGIRYLGKSGAIPDTRADLILAVSDGMGGQQSGEFASRIALDKITLLLPDQFSVPADRFISIWPDIMEQLFQSIHAAMLDLGKYDANCKDMGATLTLAWLRHGRVFFGHIGDSRLYHLPADGAMTQISEDHSHVGWLRRSGKLSEREARLHPRKNVLSQALGAGHQFLRPQLGSFMVAEGDRVLLCTDGVNEGLWDRKLEELARAEPTAEQSVAEYVVSKAVSESGRDNATAMLASIG